MHQQLWPRSQQTPAAPRTGNSTAESPSEPTCPVSTLCSPLRLSSGPNLPVCGAVQATTNLLPALLLAGCEFRVALPSTSVHPEKSQGRTLIGPVWVTCPTLHQSQWLGEWQNVIGQDWVTALLCCLGARAKYCDWPLFPEPQGLGPQAHSPSSGLLFHRAGRGGCGANPMPDVHTPGKSEAE